jgi:hypothetical protein
MATDFVAVQLAFDRLYAALLGLTHRYQSVSPARLAAGKPHSYLDAAKEEVHHLEDLVESLVALCPIVPFQSAERRIRRLHDLLLDLDLSVQDLFLYGQRFLVIEAELAAIRADLDANGIGIRHVPWYRFWQRWLR